jgi:phosphate transport system substrate-binding protein
MKNLLKIVTGAAVAAVLTTSAFAADISGAGASFPYPIYAKWGAMYKAKTGIGLNYQSIGSGGGIAQIKARTVTFGASDMPLMPKDLDKSGLIQFPTVVGGVVPVVNVKGVKPGQLILDGATLANIFQGKVAKWNDPSIAKLNPGLNLPNQAIAVVRRSDGSGTTFIFTNYLSKVSQDWKDNVGNATAVDWPVGIGAKGNEGVAGNVAQSSGSIGYVELAYATQNHLTYTRLVNKSGKTVEPSIETFQAAAANADWSKAPGMYLVVTDQPGENAWPIAGATFILMYKNPGDPQTSKAALDFFKWAYAEGDDAARKLDYVPLPKNVTDLIQNNWKQIQGSGQ